MKKLLVPFVPVFIILVILGVYFVSNRDAEQSKTFVLIKEEAGVQYKSGSEYVTLEDEQIELPSGSFVKTDQAGAQILLADNSLISLDSKTEVQINISAGEIDLVQLTGNTWNRIEKLTSNQGFRVETPSVIAAVRGTEFGVIVSGEELSDVFVTDSEVTVGKAKRNGESVDFEDRNELTKGKWYKFDHGETQINEIPEEITQSAWYKKNELLTQLINALDKSKLRELLPSLIEQIPVESGDELGESTGPSIIPGLNLYDFSQVCIEVKKAEFLEYRSVLDQQSAAIPGYGDYFKFIREYLDLMVEVCADDSLSDAEIAKMQQLQKQVESMTP